ncbi:class I SAM-dependent methyltransferase [Phenylobacterium soli]|uniref:class I SAM-dependent methyltransferase n=1 Tax=Phenylobacterium soli TaxID=2170551 RepID=UPI001D05A95B|nr:methyltransferase [Phenylobacterium soli]
MATGATTCVYGAPPAALAEVPAGAVQVSPLVPGAADLEALTPQSLAGAVVAAPPGTVERRYVLARLLAALAPGAPLTVLAPKDKGGSRLKKELEAFGCAVSETGRQHQRICQTRRPDAPAGLEAAIAAGAPRWSEELGLWTQPGVFSWDRPDPGTRQLLAVLPPLAGQGADLGCGLGVLARAVLAAPAVTRLDLIDIDARAIAAARRNVEDPRAHFHWADARLAPELAGLDFVVMNPPFHDRGLEDRELGQGFIRRAHQVLRPSGVVFLVANRHLPYEAVLNGLFSRVTARGEAAGFKVYEARR